MRKILLSIFTVFVLITTKNAKAQCDLQFSNVVISPVGDPVTLTPTKCEYRFNVSFDIITNSGFKYLFFHSWLIGDYPNPSIFNCSGNTPAADPGTSTQLGTAVDQAGKSFLDIGFIGLFDLTFSPDVPVDVTANFATIFPHDASVGLTQPSNSPGLNATITRKGTSDTLHFDVTNLRVVVNTPCNTDVIVKTDIWGSNSNAPDPKAQCYICGVGEALGDPAIALQKLCGQRLQYSVGLTSTSPVDIHVVYKLYADDLDGIREPGGDDPLLFTSAVITLNSSSPYSSGAIDLPAPYCCTDPFSQWGIFVEVTADEFENTLSTPVVEALCSALPVKLRSFTANRANSNVLLKWETVTEENSKGFDIQRKLYNGAWQNIGFVETKAINGNSNSPLVYEFIDISNNTKGITQYRLRQMDLDGKQAFSLIRSVRGDGQKGKTIVYPNPSNDGQVNVVFEDKDVSRNVSLTDVNGRVIKQWKNVLSNTLQIENLLTGFYTLRIINSETGEQIVEKIVVKDR